MILSSNHENMYSDYYETNEMPVKGAHSRLIVTVSVK